MGDYNRVDGVRLGIAAEAQDPGSMLPRAGARIEYALGRERTTYGAQLEQPLLRGARLGIGVSASRRTDHSDLQQVDDVENSLALLFARQDYRDYFEREGFGAYVAWRVQDFSIVSVHARDDTYRSLALLPDVRSLFTATASCATTRRWPRARPTPCCCGWSASPGARGAPTIQGGRTAPLLDHP